MTLASEILDDFETFEIPEGNIHSHKPEERADRFRTYGIDPATTEREYGELIYSLVRVMKPEFAVEFGTGIGLTALLMAAAIKQNRTGRLTTVDIRYMPSVKIMAKKYGLGLDFVQKRSFEYIAYMEENLLKADFVFFDTVQSDKGLAASNMLERNLIRPNGLLVFHDTSQLRFQDATNPDAANEDYQATLSNFANRADMENIDFPYSRGLTVMRYLG